MIRAVLFDLDGTLADTFEDIACAANHALERLGQPALSTDFIKTKVGHGLRNLMAELLGEGASDRVDPAMDAVKEFYEKHPTVHTRLYPGVLDTLDQLRNRGIRQGVLSNKADSLVRRIGENLGLSERMDVIWGHRDTFPLKPDPASLRAILEKLGVTPRETLFVGDAEPDLLLAKNAGTHFCGVTHGMATRDEWRRDGVCWIVDSFPEILDVIDRLNLEFPEGDRG